ncbi:hypothetical protein J2X54_001822 [Duganella sp. 3397]|uniref:hypothetical protein n=1 Tax=Duganella sp. 3397 TaxID=2817732 RepID=UPI00285BFE40|nr:hypothetical protein [Duganella sp. 3397]MDR7049367.1 hypothetical protein [Duganella sp. 3397]
MGTVEQKHYKGWTVTIRCTQRLSGMPARSRYESAATAELDPGQDPGKWIDPRIQMLDTGTRRFDSHVQCVDVLYTEVKDLIDALER